MRLRITKAIEKVVAEKFHKMMVEDGAFPEVHYETNGIWESYNMIEYSTTYARLMKLLDKKIIDAELDKLGAFTRKRSPSFLANVKTLLDGITENDVNKFPERFHTMWD